MITVYMLHAGARRHICLQRQSKENPPFRCSNAGLIPAAVAPDWVPLVLLLLCADGLPEPTLLHMQVDVWALGMTMIHLVTGEGPYPNQRHLDGHQLGFYILSTDQLYPMPEGIPATLTDLLTDCLQRDPNKRPTVSGMLRYQFFLHDVGKGQLKELPSLDIEKVSSSDMIGKNSSISSGKTISEDTWTGTRYDSEVW